VIDRAISRCADVIMERLDTISNTEIPVHIPSPSRGWNTSTLLQRFDEDNAWRFHLHGKGFVGPLCRTIFHIQKTTYPSSFIILPYKLVKDSKGGLGLESSKAAKIAMEFASYLSGLTSPKNIVHVLDEKIDQFLGSDLVDKMNRENRESQRKRKEYFTEFLKLYENQPAYFYFIDDCTGIPIVDDTNGIYPLVVTDAVEVVEKVFPLMLSGMILMRGEKALSILASVLLDENIKLVLPHWIEAAKDLVGYASSPESTKPSLKNLLPLREKLIDFFQYGATETIATERFKNGGLSSEWVVEISLIKMVVEMHDSRHRYCGLSQRKSSSQILWTQNLEREIIQEFPSQIEFMTPMALKAYLSETDLKSRNESKTLRTDMSRNDSEYKQLFDEMGLSNGSIKIANGRDNSSSSGEYTDYTSEDNMPGMIITMSERKNARSVTSQLSDHHHQLDHLLQRKTISRKNGESVRSSSLSNSDDSFDLRSVLKLQFQLDEQESKLELLRQKVSDLDTAGDQMIRQEEKITNMIGEILNQKDEILQNSTRDGLAKARALMMRICELEDRVLCREVEVGQLKNDVSLFQLEASDRSASRCADGTNSSSRNSAARKVNPADEHSVSPDEDINSVELNSVFRGRREAYFVQDDNGSIFRGKHQAYSVQDGDDGDSTVGNSTMYNSSFDGYSAGLDGYPAGMLNR